MNVLSSKITSWLAILLAAATIALEAPRDANAFCGFFVGKADATLVNHASEVAIARHDHKTVISMSNDYRGEPKDFAMVVPVPVVLQKGQVHVGDPELFRRIEAYSAPRLVEYYDPDPCEVFAPREVATGVGAPLSAAPGVPIQRAQNALGVKIEAQYSVGEYDIVILSAQQSDGLESWLRQNGYKIPAGASAALAPYIRQDMKFFVAKVNLKEHQKSGIELLRPIQFAFESPKFMLPIRLGMINSSGAQDLIVYILTRDGRVETTNYRTVKLPSGENVPESVRDDFQGFYKAMFSEQVRRNDMRAVFTEYTWNMGWCDPCAAPPLTPDELRALGVFWLDESPPRGPVAPLMYGGRAAPVILTRLHLSYTAQTFPEDLVFQETQDTENYQARYVMQHPWSGDANACPAAKNYFVRLRQRKIEEAETLAELTGWNLDSILKKAGLNAGGVEQPWWQKIWQYKN